MYTLGNLGVRRVQDASAKRIVGRRKITREAHWGSPFLHSLRAPLFTFCRLSPFLAFRVRGIRLFITRRLQRRSLRLPTRSKSAQTGHLCTTAQAGGDPGIFVCRSKFPGLKVGRRSLLANMALQSST